MTEAFKSGCWVVWTEAGKRVPGVVVSEYENEGYWIVDFDDYERTVHEDDLFIR